MKSLISGSQAREEDEVVNDISSSFLANWSEQNNDAWGVFWTDFENSSSNMAQIWWAGLAAWRCQVTPVACRFTGLRSFTISHGPLSPNCSWPEGAPDERSLSERETTAGWDKS